MASSEIVLALDYSLALSMRNLWDLAKEVAMAAAAQLERFGSTILIAYSETARVLAADELADTQWDFVYGSNLHDALMLSMRLLENAESKRVVFLADTEPTAHRLPGGQVFFKDFSTTDQTIEATLDEAQRCSRSDIRIDFFLLRRDAPVRPLAEQIAATCHGQVDVYRSDEPITTAVER